ncbi:hypothetical protein EAH80_19690 [Mycobacterium hodleri]|uniref:Uncharacterized protein n=1 Tax=Mycolicibacterium hodleri TaxID=49897 RepID=A0A502E6N0_9MYCO|nr:hypothetical protein EAH80_19690 [Mycolicibacterium hodleri]
MEGRRLIPDPGNPSGYRWGGDAVKLDENGLWPMVPDPAAVPLPADSEAAFLADRFDEKSARSSKVSR